MKLPLFVTLLLAVTSTTRAQLYEQNYLVALDVDWDQEVDIRSGIIVSYLSTSQQHRVFCCTALSWGRGRFLKNEVGGLDHSLGSEVSAGLPLYTATPPYNDYSLAAVLYYWQIRQPGGDLIITPGTDLFPTQLSCIIAFKVEFFDGWRVGWVRFRRPSADLGIAYRFDGLGYNPFPDKPIRAGFPAELPPVQTTVSEDGQSLHLSWEPGYPGVFLLATPDLTPPVEWTPVDLSGANEAVVPLPTEGQVFFKLVHEP